MNGVELVTTWLTPTVLFCILNLMIGTIFITSSLKPQTKQKSLKDEQSPQLVRVPSIFERVKSINLSRYQSEQPDHPAHQQEPDRVAHQQEPDRVAIRSKSHTAEARVLKKSVSEKVVAAEKREEVDERRPATVRQKATAAEIGGEDEAVDAKADDFINRFKQQLKLQRLDSILRYKQMLNRGMGR